MKRFALAPGVRLRLDEEPYLVLSQEGDHWLVRAASDGATEMRSNSDFLTLYVQGRLELAGRNRASAGEAEAPASRPFSDLSLVERERSVARYCFLERVQTLMADVPRGARQQGLLRALEVASRELGGGPPVSPATYFRWKGSLATGGDVCDLAGRFRFRGRPKLRDRRADIAHGVMRQAIVDASADPPVRRTMAWITEEIGRQIEEEMAAQPTPALKRLAPPSRATLYRMWAEIPAHERDRVRYGANKTRALYRAPTADRFRPELPLDLGEYDETRLPLFFFDEAMGTALGRPWMNWVLDVATHMPAGIYLGFEPPGDLTIASTLRHACLPKVYVASEYPDIKNSYPAHGIFRRLTFDNEAMAHGTSAEMITYDLNTQIGIAPSRTPWFKSTVEGMFNALNQLLLRELPGFVLSPDLDRSEYDPQQNGCIGLRYFLYLFHHWLIDSYIQRPIAGGRSPAERWREGVANWPPDLIGRARDLDLLFGVLREGRLDHRGVVYEGLRYYSPELHHLRIRSGHTQKVRVKINPTNLRFVHVHDAVQDKWVRAEALKAAYATGLSLHCHTLIRRAARANGGETEADGLEAAQQRLRALIADSYGKAMSVQSAGLLARTVGLGTQHIFDHIDANGQLGPLSGPFAEQPLNPWKDPARPAPEEAPELAVPAAAQSLRARRNKPKLRADHSLRRPSPTHG